MSVISNGDLQTVLDKLARFGGESVDMAAAAANVFSGAGAMDTFILATADVDVVADLLPASRDLDEDPPTVADGFVANIASIKAMIDALNAHLVRYGPTGTKGLDDYLSTLNLSTPTLRVHADFRKYLATVSAKNTFIATDTVLATFTASGAAAGVYAHVATIDKTKYAGAQLVVKNQGAVTTGATLTVTGKKLDLTTQSLTATIATGTDNFETNLSVVLKNFIDVTNITITGATSTNVYEIVAKTDRSVAAA